MKIKKVPLEYGWDWHLNSYRFIKENFKDYLFIGFFFIVNLLFIRLIPYVGHFIAAATLVPLIHVLYATFEEKKHKDYKFILSEFISSFKKDEYKNLIYFKLATSILTYLLMISVNWKTKFLPISMMGLYLEIISVALMFHAVGLTQQFGMGFKPAIKQSVKNMLSNFMSEHLYIAWFIILSLSSTLPAFVGWVFAAPLLAHSANLKFETLYENEINHVERVESEASFQEAV
jgi:hypothetical protein